MNPYITKTEAESLSREVHAIPKYIVEALKDSSLETAYKERPAYQKNDYVGWINRAKRDSTKQRRLEQMLEELEAGDRYMKMEY